MSYLKLEGVSTSCIVVLDSGTGLCPVLFSFAELKIALFIQTVDSQHGIQSKFKAIPSRQLSESCITHFSNIVIKFYEQGK